MCIRDRTFIKFAASALSEKDLGQLLSTAWTQEECPNQDCNVSKRELVALFRSVPPESLMDEEERAGMRAFARELAPMLSSAQKEKLAAVLQRLGMQEGQ